MLVPRMPIGHHPDSKAVRTRQITVLIAGLPERERSTLRPPALVPGAGP
jgi:hypothetical protein